jgi:hypothetical protein
MNLELEPGDWVDDFQIERVLARSGMGSVFTARQRTAGRTVVLEVPHLHLESDVVFFSRFRREESIGLRLNHPAIVRVIRARRPPVRRPRRARRAGRIRSMSIVLPHPASCAYLTTRVADPSMPRAAR